MRPLKKTLIGVACLVAAGVAPGSAAAAPARLYVDAGSIGGRCSDDRQIATVASNRPLCTLERAVALAREGGTVVVRAGNYPQLRLTGVSPSAQLVLQAAPGERPVLGGMEITGSRNLRIDGFRTTDVSVVDTSENFELSGSELTPQGLVLRESHHVRVLRNEIHHTVIDMQPPSVPGPRCHGFSPNAGIAPRCGDGIRLGGSSDVLIQGNHIHDLPADGIRGANNRDLTIVGNRIHDIRVSQDPTEHVDSIQLVGANDNIRIASNAIYQTRGPLIQPFTDGRPGVTTGLVVENNVIGQLRDWGLKLMDTDAARIVNNTIWTSAHGVVFADEPSNPSRARGTVIANNFLVTLEASPEMLAYEDHNLIGGGLRTGSHDLGGQPAFVAPTQMDYGLAGGSLGIDAGTPAYAPASDGLGRQRNGTPDLGALEYGGAPATPAPAAPKPPVAAKPPAKTKPPARCTGSARARRAHARKRLRTRRHARHGRRGAARRGRAAACQPRFRNGLFR